MNDDIGYEPLGNGRFEMFPSGEIVGWDEARRRCPINKKPLPDGAFGLSWDQLQRMQGGKITKPSERRR